MQQCHSSPLTMRVMNPEAGILPNIPHFFSTVVTRQGADDGCYYELTGVYHRRYPSLPAFKAAWQQMTRRFHPAPVAVEKRVRKVLWRAQVPAYRFRYAACVHLFDEAGQVRAMRHVAQVTLADADVDFLLGQGMLRLLYDGRRDKSDKHKAIIYGLAPLQNRAVA